MGRYDVIMRRFGILIVWLIADILLFVASYVVAYFLRIGFFFSTDLPIEQYLQTVILVAPLWLIVLISLRVFGLTRVQSSFRNLLYIVYACAMGTALFSLMFFFIYGAFFSRLMLLYAGVCNLITTVVAHSAFDQIQRRMLRKNPPAYPLLIIGANREAEKLIGLLNSKESVFKPVAVLDSTGTAGKDVAGVPVKGKLNSLEDVIKSDRITHLAQCAELEHTMNLLSVCRQHGITYMLLPSVLGIVQGDETVEVLEGKQAVTMVRQSRSFAEWFIR